LKGIALGLKDAYYKLEEKWYLFLDGINRFFPIYKIIDPIDSAIPSFIVFLLVVAAVAVYFLLPFISVLLQPGVLEVKVTDKEGNGLRNATVEYKIAGILRSIETNNDGIAEIPAKVGEEILLSVEAEGYETSSDSVQLLEEKQMHIMKLQLFIAEHKIVNHLVEFVNDSGLKIEGTEISATFFCSSGEEIINPTRTTSSGSIEITSPSLCGVLSAQVSAEGYEDSSFGIFDAVEIITLTQNFISYGGIRVFVKEEGTGKLLDGILLEVRDTYGVLQDTTYSDWGEATFEIESGEYVLSLQDPTEKYPSTEENVSVSGNDLATITIELAQQARAAIEVTILDISNSQPIEDAEVALLNSEGIEISSSETDLEGTVNFKVLDAEVYYVRASHPDYLPSSDLEIDASSASVGAEFDVEISLEQLTELNSGRVMVSVKDEEGQGVGNATVYLFYADSGFLTPYEGKITNNDGNITDLFIGVDEGSYYVVAQKYPASGESSVFELDLRELNNVDVTIYIGKGIVDVQAEDIDGMEIPFAHAEIFTVTGESLGILALDESGRGNLEIKADKKVFVSVTADNYAKYISSPKQVESSRSISFTAVMEEQITGTSPSIDFVGVYPEFGDAAVSNMEAGSKYFAKFVLRVPENTSFEEVGVHLRTGEQTTLEQDDIFIESIEAPAGNVIRGTSYFPSVGEELGFTNGKAKWGNVTWFNPEGGVYNLEAIVKIKEEIIPGSELTVNYRTWGISSGQWQRDPYDAELGTFEETPTKKALYANSYARQFTEGAEEECDNGICFQKRILDVSGGLFLSTEPYITRVFDDYELTFAITNNSNAAHTNAGLSIKNLDDSGSEDESLYITHYELVNASGIRFEEDNAGYGLTDSFSMGNLEIGKSFTGTINFKPEELTTTNFEFRVVSESLQMFKRNVSFAVVSEKSMTVTSSPDIIAPFTETEVSITARDDVDNTAIENALVVVKITDADGSNSLIEENTDSVGFASFTIPSLSNGATVEISVQQPGYANTDILYSISNENVVSVNPESITGFLNAIGVSETDYQLEFTNYLSNSLTLSNTSVEGNFEGLLDKERMENWLGQYQNSFSIAGNGNSFINVKASISSLASTLEETKRVLGSLLFEFTIPGTEGIYPVKVPLDFTIGLSEAPADETCLYSTLTDWRATTLENRVTKQFTLNNLCLLSSGEGLGVNQFGAKLDWTSNVIGQVEIAILDPETGNSTSAVLQNGRKSTLMDNLQPDKDYIVTISFVPNAGTLGQVANFTVAFEGEILTNEGKKIVSTPSPVSANLLIANLEQCITFTPSANTIVEIGASEPSTTITVDTTNCGDLPVELKFCNGGADSCRGGSQTGGITVRPWSTLGVTETTFDVMIERQSIPGMYGLEVEARAPGSSWRDVTTIDILIQPPPDYTFYLDRYEFMLRGEGSKDSTTVTNENLSEIVSVEASICDWGKAMEDDSWFDPEYAGAGAITGALYGMQSTMNSSKQQTTNYGTEKYIDLSNSKKAIEIAEGKVKEAEKCLEKAKEKTNETAQEMQGNQAQVMNCPAAANYESAVTPMTNASTDAEEANTNMTTSKTHLETSKTQTDQAQSTATINNMSQATESFGQAQTIMVNARQSIHTSSVQAKQSEKKNESAISRTERAGTTLTNLQGPVTQQKETACTCCDSPAACQCNECTACTQAETTIQQMIPKVQQAKQGHIDCRDEIEAAKDAIKVAREANTKGNESLGDLSNAVDKPQRWYQGACDDGLDKFACSMALYTGAGYLAGGILGGLQEDDTCDELLTADLVDYTINLVDDAKKIGSDVSGIDAKWNLDDAHVFGQFDRQTVGMEVQNSGVEEPKPIYGVLSLEAEQHIHDNPTSIRRGEDDFGPFNVPDARVDKISRKFHVKYTTGDIIEESAVLEGDIAACSKGTLLGRTGEGALPDVKLSWSYRDIGMFACDEDYNESVYCDATQFNMEVSRKLNALLEFINLNGAAFLCPENPEVITLQENLGDVDLNVNYMEEFCWVENTTEVMEGKPSLIWFVEDASSIQWTEDIPDIAALENMIQFDAKLIFDGYTTDMVGDFGHYYSNINFSDTPSWFREVGVDNSGEKYGLNEYWNLGQIKFKNRYYDESVLPAAGIFRININTTLNENWELFDDTGIIVSPVEVAYEYFQSPDIYSPFLDLPFDGAIGLEGTEISRQGYGAGYTNLGEEIKINDGAEVVYTYTGIGSNPLAPVIAEPVEEVYYLNTSPVSRGDLLLVQSPVTTSDAKLTLSASKATPLLLQVSAQETSSQVMVANTLTEAQGAINTGDSLTYWTGVGSCDDFSGVPAFEKFNFTPDRAGSAELSRVPLGSYAIEWDNVENAGNMYLRTILYTPVDKEMQISTEGIGTTPTFFGADEQDTQISLNGISGMEFNQPGSSAFDRPDSLEDIFLLVKNQSVCATNSGSEARFFWNIEEIYSTSGARSSINDQIDGIGSTLSCS